MKWIFLKNLELSLIKFLISIPDTPHKCPRLIIFFLSGIIKKFHPENIIEIGVASGLTTLILARTMYDLGIRGNITSVDISSTFCNDINKRTGFLFNEYRSKTMWEGEYHLFCGLDTIRTIEKLNVSFDLCILDTRHTLPGELLDFICILPFMKSKSLIVLHDINWDQYIREQDQFLRAEMIKASNGILFSSVVSPAKFINSLNNNFFPNIGAFVVDANTTKYILNIFLSLMILWHSMPDQFLLDNYRYIISKYYPKELLHIYDAAYSKNKLLHNK